ncbi:hypothetical protein [Streptomyces sp. NPDC003006]
MSRWPGLVVGDRRGGRQYDPPVLGGDDVWEMAWALDGRATCHRP